jgi:mevalonate kinase
LSIPILINSKDNIEATGIPTQSTQGKGAVFLIDSGIVGETAPMVSIFMEKLKDNGFRTMLKSQFIKYTDACVENFLNGDLKSLLGNTKSLSKVVLQNFKPMIPEHLISIWQKGIDTNAYYLKLCGSGGGGFVLGFTEDFEKAQESLKDYKLELVYKF